VGVDDRDAPDFALSGNGPGGLQIKGRTHGDPNGGNAPVSHPIHKGTGFAVNEAGLHMRRKVLDDGLDISLRSAISGIVEQIQYLHDSPPRGAINTIISSYYKPKKDKKQQKGDRFPFTLIVAVKIFV